MKAVLASLAALLTLGCLATVNSSIVMPPGTRSWRTCRSVNGDVQLGEGSSADGVSTVNGAIRVGPGCLIEDDLVSVNGDVTCAPHTRVLGSVKTINGRIELRQTQVGSNVSTYNGAITLQGATIAGDIVIKKPDSRGDGSVGEPLVICLSEGTEIRGGIKVEEQTREVEVRLSPDSSIRGSVGRAKITKL